MAKIENNFFYRGKIRGFPLSFFHSPKLQPNCPFQILQKMATFRYCAQVILRSDGRSFTVFRATFLHNIIYDVIWKEMKKATYGTDMCSHKCHRGAMWMLEKENFKWNQKQTHLIMTSYVLSTTKQNWLPQGTLSWEVQVRKLSTFMENKNIRRFITLV